MVTFGGRTKDFDDTGTFQAFKGRSSIKFQLEGAD